MNSEESSESKRIFEQIKQEYQENSRIELFIDPTITLPLEQSYINLSIVETKEQQGKENRLQHAQDATSVINAYEDIHGVKTPIDVRDIFNTCETHEKQVLVFGRAGIGKSTFCRYITYQWAMGSYWSHFDLLALIPLRQLTANRYPPGNEYRLIDVIKRELFPLDMTAKEEEELMIHFNAKKTLWILDGYDEIVQNTSPHLQTLLAKLLNTPHHIITSRPYLNKLSYKVQMEIIGFTDDNIHNYINNFFHQMQDVLEVTPSNNEILLKFLQSNPSIWGVAHIPVNLELICTLWVSEEWAETNQMTVTKLYIMMTQWLCRRYLTAQAVPIQHIGTYEVYEHCREELIFIETLAFHAMQSNTILLQPILLKMAMNAANISRQKYSLTLNMGILKSVNKKGINTQIEPDKDHYFIHLSFQEYFAARYLSNALNGSQSEEVMKFIRQHKYNQRYTLLFSFTSGLLSENGNKSSFDLFWDALLGPPVDLIGIRHMQVVIACMEEVSNTTMFPRRSFLLEWIIECLRYSLNEDDKTIRNHIIESLQRAQSIACDQVMTNFLIDSVQNNHNSRKTKALTFIRQLNLNHLSNVLIASTIPKLDDENAQVRIDACNILSGIGMNAATNEVTRKLMICLDDENEMVKKSAYCVLEEIGAKAVTDELINKLVSAVVGQDEAIRDSACHALSMMGEKAATNDVLTKLVNALEDQCESIRCSACVVLRSIGERAATNAVISKLVTALEDQNEWVRIYACSALGKICEKAATNELINKFVSILDDQSHSVRLCARSVLEQMGRKAATTAVISRLLSGLDDQNECVRANVCCILGDIGEKAATNEEVISKLLNTLEDHSDWVRQCACSALRNIGEESATNEVISKLVNALEDQRQEVRSNACTSLGMIGKKKGTNEIICKLVSAVNDTSSSTRASACLALGNVGEEAATEEVISKLLSSLEDDDGDVRWYAACSLGRMGDKAATNEVMSKILSLVDSDKIYLTEFLDIFEYIFRSPQVMKQFNPMIFKQILLKYGVSEHSGNISEKDFINIFYETRDLNWLPVLLQVILGNGTAIVDVEDKLIVYGKVEPYELPVVNSELYRQLVTAFTDESKRWHLRLQL